MRGTDHARWAALFGAAYVAISGYWLVSPAGAAAAVGIFTLGAVLPDVDEPHSDISGVLGAPSRLGARGIRASHHHRGWTHTIWCSLAALTLASLAHPLAPTLAVALAAGILLHLAQDATTPAGVALFWPLTSWRLRLGLHISRLTRRNRRRRRT